MSAMTRHIIDIVFLTVAWIGCAILTVISETLWVEVTALLFAFVAFAILVIIATIMLFYDDLKDM